jgi:hypothetical protein
LSIFGASALRILVFRQEQGAPITEALQSMKTPFVSRGTGQAGRYSVVKDLLSIGRRTTG